MNTLAITNLPSRLSSLSDEVISRIERIFALLKKNKSAIEISMVAVAVEGILIVVSPPLAGFTAVFGLSTGVPLAIIHVLEHEHLR